VTSDSASAAGPRTRRPAAASASAERLVESQARDAGALFEQLGKVVLGYLRSQGAADPDDLLGEVFLHVSRDLDRFRGDEGQLRRWVFTIAHHRLVDDRRRRGARPQVVSSELPELPDDEIPDPVDPQMVAALGALTELQRQVVTLRFVADLTLGEVARIVRRPVGAVKSVQKRALDQLALMLGEP